MQLIPTVAFSTEAMPNIVGLFNYIIIWAQTTKFPMRIVVLVGVVISVPVLTLLPFLHKLLLGFVNSPLILCLWTLWNPMSVVPTIPAAKSMFMFPAAGTVHISSKQNFYISPSQVQRLSLSIPA